MEEIKDEQGNVIAHVAVSDEEAHVRSALSEIDMLIKNYENNLQVQKIFKDALELKLKEYQSQSQPSLQSQTVS